MLPKYRFNLCLKFPPRAEIAGDWSGLKSGSGYEFRSLRRYELGDSFRHIDWKARARTGKLYVRDFARDTAYPLMLLCDVSPSMDYGGKRLLMRDIAVSMTHAALQENNMCGLLLYADGIEKYIPPSCDPRQMERIAHQLDTFTCDVAKKTSLLPALKFMKQKIPSCLGIILSDFQYSRDDLHNLSVALFQGRINAYEFVVLHLLSGIEIEHYGAQVGTVCVRDVESGEQRCVDLSRWRDYNSQQQQRWMHVTNVFARSGVSSLRIKVGESHIQDKVNNMFVFHSASRR